MTARQDLAWYLWYLACAAAEYGQDKARRIGEVAAEIQMEGEMRIVDSYMIRANELKPGDVMIGTVTLHIMRETDGTLVYRMYRCREDLTYDGIPQGCRIGNEKAVMEQLFPVVGWVDSRPDS